MSFDDETIYDDNELSGPPQVFHRAPELYEPLEDKNVTESLWFAGNINRQEAEARITGPGVPGNFLVRQKDRSRKVFAHSYLSRTKGKCVHNLIELKQSGEWSVDGAPFSARTLDELVDKLQHRLRSWRKLEDAPQYIKQQVQENFHIMYMPNIDRIQATSYLMNKPPGAFVIRNSTTPNCYALCVKKHGQGPDSIYNGIIVQSNQGVYLKFSELMGSSLEELTEIMLANGERLVAGGVPVPLVAPNPNEPVEFAELEDDIYEDGDAPPPMRGRALPPPPPGGGGGGFEEYAEDGDYDDGEAIYDESEDPPPLPAGRGGGRPPLPPPGGSFEEDIYDDAENPDGDIYDDAEDPSGGAPPLPGRPVSVGITMDGTIYDDEESAMDGGAPPLPGRNVGDRKQAYGMPPELDDAPPPLPGRSSDAAIMATTEDIYDDDDYDDGAPPPIVSRGGDQPPLPPRPGAR